MDNRNQNLLYILGNNIHLARKGQNLTMQEVADRTGLCRQTISDVESGNPATGIGIYLEVADAVGVSIDSNILPQVLYRSPNRINILNKCNGLTADGVHFVIESRKGTDLIRFKYNGSNYEIPFAHSDPGMTTKGKSVYQFEAASIVTEAIEQIQLKKGAELFLQ